MKLARDIMTEDPENKTWDPLRIAFAISFAVANGLSIYAIIGQGQEFDVVSYSTGMGALIGVTGAGLWASSWQKDAKE